MSTDVLAITDFTEASSQDIEETYESYSRKIEEIDREIEVTKRKMEEGREKRQNVSEMHQRIRALETERISVIEEKNYLVPILGDARAWKIIRREEFAVERYPDLIKQNDPLASGIYRSLSLAYVKLCELRQLQTNINNTYIDAGSLASGLASEYIRVPAENIEELVRQALEAIERVNYRFSTGTYPALESVGIKVDQDRLNQFVGRKEIVR